MQSSSSIRGRVVLALVACALLASGCAANNASVPAPQAAAAPEVVEVEGQVVEVGGRRVAYIEAFPSPHTALLGAPVQLRVPTVQADPLTAVVTRVEPRLDGWLEVEADLVQRDVPLATATPFTGQIILKGR